MFSQIFTSSEDVWELPYQYVCSGPSDASNLPHFSTDVRSSKHSGYSPTTWNGQSARRELSGIPRLFLSLDWVSLLCVGDRVKLTIFENIVLYHRIAVWSIAASFIVHLQSLHGQHYSFGRRITASNCLGVVPIFHLVVFIPLDVIAGTHYANTIVLSRKINNYLLKQANTWTLTSGFDVNNLLPMVPDVLALEAGFAALKPVWQAT